MSKLPLLSAVAVALTLAAPASAALDGAAARINAVFAGAGPTFGGWASAAFQPASLPAVRVRVFQAPGNSGPLVPRAMWDQSTPLTPQQIALIASRVPNFDAGKTREASYEQVAAVVGETARRGDSILDLFSDSGLRGDVAYFLSATTMARLYRDFDLHASLPVSGTASNGQPFLMQGLVMGRGTVSILYNLDGFEFQAGGKTYKARSRVGETIQGPGTLGVSGLWVKVWPFTPEIQRLTKLGNGRMRVDTNKGSRDMDDNPITRR